MEKIKVLGRVPFAKKIDKNFLRGIIKRNLVMKKIILNKDKQFLWHPFTQSNHSNDPIIIKKCKK